MTAPSEPLFVRGQYQIARYEPESPATGRRLTEHEVRETYGDEVVHEIDEYLAAVLLKREGVIEAALRGRREALGVTHDQFARAARVRPKLIDLAETDADQVELRELERLAFALGLDPAKLSVDEHAGADSDLGFRLRVLETDRQAAGAALSARTVLRFTEAASIIRSQLQLQRWLDQPAEAIQFKPSRDYGPPAWRAGYELAEFARESLGLGLTPISSMRALVERRLGIPVIQVALPKAIAGATISSNGQRGIVLNTEGANSNVWIRRATLAHELGHILFDPEKHLSSVRVDSYSEMERNAEHGKQSLDSVEQRANAFAIEFLAPREAVLRLVPSPARVSAESIANVMETFGLGRAAARYHVGNAWWGQAVLPYENSIHADPTDEQQAAEDFVLDYFPLRDTPEQRRGRFALLAVEAVQAGLITTDTAAQYLLCSDAEFREALPSLLGLA